MGDIRPCRDDEREAILAIVNAAAEAYRGVIPADRWHEPYMPVHELDGEIAAGVVFWGYEADGELAGIMGVQDVGDFDLIRHAYVSPGRQGVRPLVRGRGQSPYVRGTEPDRGAKPPWAPVVASLGSFSRRHTISPAQRRRCRPFGLR
jgi:hypothetical protein